MTFTKYDDLDREHDPMTITMEKDAFHTKYIFNLEGSRFSIEKDRYGNYCLTSFEETEVMTLSKFAFMRYVENEIGSFFYDFLKQVIGHALLDGISTSVPLDFIHVGKDEVVTLTLHSDIDSSIFSLSYDPKNYDEVTIRFKGEGKGVYLLRSEEGKYASFLDDFDYLFDCLSSFMDTSIQKQPIPLESEDFIVKSTPSFKEFVGNGTLSIYKDNENDYYFSGNSRRNSRQDSTFILHRKDSTTLEGVTFDHFFRLMKRIYGQVVLEGNHAAHWYYPDDFLDPNNKKITLVTDRGNNKKLELIYEKDTISVQLLTVDKTQPREFDVEICTSGSRYKQQWTHFMEMFNEMSDTFGFMGDKKGPYQKK